MFKLTVCDLLLPGVCVILLVLSFCNSVRLSLKLIKGNLLTYLLYLSVTFTSAKLAVEFYKLAYYVISAHIEFHFFPFLFSHFSFVFMFIVIFVSVLVFVNELDRLIETSKLSLKREESTAANSSHYILATTAL